MIRVAEAVLPGHPDKLCDQIADAIIAESYRADDRAYAQVEVAIWDDTMFLSGGIATRKPLARSLAEIAIQSMRDVGYTGENAVQADRFIVVDKVCQDLVDPRRWTDHVNDQCIVVGYAGYDALTRFLPPEQFLALSLREALADSCRSDLLKGQGPDGKLLVRVRENADEWVCEHVLATLQQLVRTDHMEFSSRVLTVLRDTYDRLRAADPRWVAPYEDIQVLINPNGPLVNGGPDGDNGQTGRKLVVDQYGPRVPIGGGALSGKDLSHIDRAGNYAARQAAIGAVVGGAKECLVRVSYAPNEPQPLDVAWDMTGRGPRVSNEWFDHRKVVERLKHFSFDPSVAATGHYYDLTQEWNQPASAQVVD